MMDNEEKTDQEKAFEALADAAQYQRRRPGMRRDTRNSCRPPGADSSDGVYARGIIRRALKVLTPADEQAIAKAEAKRDRKRAQRLGYHKVILEVES